MTISASASREVREGTVVAYKTPLMDVICAGCAGKYPGRNYQPLQANSRFLPRTCPECGRSLRFLD